MIRLDLSPDEIYLSPELGRTGSAKAFEERLRASIDEIGLAEPLKVALDPEGRHVVIDGALRLRAILAIRKKSPERFKTIPVYCLNYEQRYEIRFQSDVYQDLLPSQMAAFVEHLHQTEHVRKAEIARYIGVSPATLRNYTGLWRLMQRGGLFARIVELMDLGVVPASNPYAWLRLTEAGLRKCLEDSFAQGASAEDWLDEVAAAARQGAAVRHHLKYVQAATDALPPEYYREGQDVRIAKRDLGLRRAAPSSQSRARSRDAQVSQHLQRVTQKSSSPLLRSAASNLWEFLK